MDVRRAAIAQGLAGYQSVGDEQLVCFASLVFLDFGVVFLPFFFFKLTSCWFIIIIIILSLYQCMSFCTFTLTFSPRSHCRGWV